MKNRRNGRANFYSLKEEITKLINNGHTGIYIYQKLKEEEKLTISYPQFQRYLSELKQKETPTNKRPSVQASKVTTPSVKPQKSQQVQPEQKSNTDEKPKDPFRRKSRPLHNPNISDEEFKNLIG
ncbi:hypothetical protein BBN09_10760 [Vibrio parahaemolyticus]|jgi:predicted nucleic acid-binding protein|uniref:TraK family protein n=1 Tax=Vibrio parahaemolyticus TaxID=670 RepID=UPI00084B6A28|nr:TraK family protein [Vibrio parahaemolyticus]OEB90911.1 hypothetical protein BBN09_10760 [Vibrio parahaemolyticus]